MFSDLRGPHARILKEIDLPIVSINDCVTAYAKVNYSFNPKTTICAGYVQGGKDTCQGQSLK